MPHDAKGRLIELGDYVKAKPLNHSEEFVAGRVVRLRTGQICSGDVRWCGIGQNEEDAFDAADATLIAKADGRDGEAMESYADAG